MRKGASQHASFLLLAIAAVALTLGLLARDYMEELRNTRSWLGHTHQVIETLKDFGLALGDAERGQRGFIVTGRDEYLTPYQSALDRIALLQGDLQNLTADNPAQKVRLRALSPIVQRKLQELMQTIDLRRRAGQDAAVALVETGQGWELMAEI